MPSGLSDTIVETILDLVVGSGANTAILGGATRYLDLLTTAPSDDNGTGAVSWGQGRVAVSMTSSAVWPGAADRATVSAAILCASNASGDTITVEAFGWYSASTAGTYLGGGPLPDGTLDIDDGDAITLAVTLAAPSPSD